MINRSFQLRFALYFCAGLLALSFIYPIIIFNLFEFFLSHLKLDQGGAPFQKISETKSQVLWFLVGFQATFLALCFLIGLFISHRVAGPLHKLKTFFVKAKEGDLTQELKFRKKDYFQDLALDYNDMISAIRARNEKQADAISAALAHLDQGTEKDVEAAVAALKTTE